MLRDVPQGGVQSSPSVAGSRGWNHPSCCARCATTCDSRHTRPVSCDMLSLVDGDDGHSTRHGRAATNLGWMDEGDGRCRSRLPTTRGVEREPLRVSPYKPLSKTMRALAMRSTFCHHHHGGWDAQRFDALFFFCSATTRLGWW